MTRSPVTVSDLRYRMLCERCTIADRPLSRLRGLLGRSELPPGEGLLLRPSPSIHTWFMRFPIAALFLDRDLCVLAVRRELRPWRMAWQKGARAVLEIWLDPLAVWCWALFGAGLVVASAAASILRPLVLLPLLRRAGDAVLHPPDRPWPRAARAGGAIAVGGLAIADPLTVLEVVVVSAGLLLVVAGASELLRLVGGPVEPRVRVRHVGRSARIVALAVTLVAGLAVAAFAVAGDPEPVQVGRCNGQAALCDRTLDQVAFVGTHNSMAADGEPGWLFVAQDAGIDAQLREGVRALLIDTHYGFATPRGVATDLSRASKSREKI